MSYIKADNPKEQKHFDFLERLRQSGVTNMFAASPYLELAFPRDFSKHGRSRRGGKNFASEITAKWIKLHSVTERVLPAKPRKYRKSA